MKRSRLLWLAFCGALVVLSGCVPHQGAGVSETLRDTNQLANNPRIADYLLSKHQQMAMFRIGIYWDDKLGINRTCAEEASIKPCGFVLLQPIVFENEAAHPREGAWQQRFTFERCGHKQTYNGIFLARADAAPLNKPLPPGTTNTSLLLLHDALQSAIIAAYLKLDPQENGKKCDNIELIGMELATPPNDAGPDRLPVQGSWTETWTLNGCGKNVTVTGEFVPNNQGGTSFRFE